MPDVGVSIAADQDSSSGAGAQELISADTPVSTQSPSGDVEALHEFAKTHQAELHEEMVEAREVLHMGTASDAIELANRGVQQEARDAAARWRASTRA